jgi:hypothetical protein
MSAWSNRIRWGVIDDARARQHRFRRRGSLAALVVLAVAAVAVVVFSGGGTPGGEARPAVPDAGQVTGSLRALPVSDYAFWVTPTLSAGSTALDIKVNGPMAQWGMGGCCTGVAGRSAIIGIDVVSAGGRVSVQAPVSFNEQDADILLVSSNIAAVRVGRFGSVGAVRAVGLQPGEKVVAFSVPRSHRVREPFSGPSGEPPGQSASASVQLAPTVQVLGSPWKSIQLAPLTALAANGAAVPILSGKATTIEQTTTHEGACAVSSNLAGVRHAAARSVSSITPMPATSRSIFLSCLNETAAYQGSNLQIAILISAHHPSGHAPPLWGSTPLPGHPGLLELKPPSAFGFNTDTGAPIIARRAANAWLIVAGRPGIAPAPTLAQRIKILDSYRITRLQTGA